MTRQRKIAKCVVVKLGSSCTITHRGKLDKFRITQLIKQTRLLQERGFVVVFVISGAVVCGESILPHNKVEGRVAKQLAAGIGQAYIVSELYKIFRSRGLMFAQVLITKNDLEDYSKQEALKDTMRLALKTNVVLVLNENDVVELHSFGGNDFLAGKVVQLLNADYLLLLTDVDGVYSEEKQILQTINAREVKELSIGKSERASGNGRVGGIQSKVEAGRIAAQSGIKAIIANGKSKDILLRLILNQEKLGTRISR